jgi:hypothetical protein
MGKKPLIGFPSSGITHFEQLFGYRDLLANKSDPMGRYFLFLSRPISAVPPM